MVPIAMAFAAGISIWNGIEASKAKSQALRGSRDAKRDAASKTMEAFELNAEFTRLEGKQFASRQKGAIAASGIDVGSGLALRYAEETADKIERRIYIEQMQAEAKRDHLLMSADLDQKASKDATKQGMTDAVGSFMGMASRSQG